MASGGSWVTDLPPNTQLLGVTLSNGIATIDIASTGEFDPSTLPSTSRLRVSSITWTDSVAIDLLFSQLVFTATQFPFVDGVLFKLDGQPLKAQIINVQALKAGFGDNLRHL